MVNIQLPGRDPIVMSDEMAAQLYDALWEGAAAVRGSVAAAAQIKRAMALNDSLRTPLRFDGNEAEAVSAALLRRRAGRAD